MDHENRIEPTSLLDTFSDAVILLDQTANILFANEHAAAFVGTHTHKLLGYPLWQAVPQLVTTTFYQAVINTIRTRISTQVKYYAPITQTWLHMYLTPTREGIALFFHEETEPPPLQNTFQQGAERHIDLLETISERVALLSPEGLLLEITQQPLTDAHVQREEVIGKPFIYFPSWSSMPVVQEQLSAAIARASKGDIARFEARTQPQPEHYLDLAVTLTPHRDVNQQVEYLISTTHDITAHKQDEEDLRSLVEEVPQFIFTARPDGAITFSNQRWLDYLGMSAEQAYGFKWRECIHPDDRQRSEEEREAAIAAGRPYEVEYRLKNGASGNYRWFLARAMPKKNAHGTILSWSATITDIDERKRIEQALHHSQERVQALMASNIIGIFIAEEEEILEANETFLRMTGYSQEDLRQRRLNWMNLTAPEYITRTNQAHQQITLHEYLPAYEKEYVGKDGSRLPVLVGGIMTQSEPLQTICFVLDNSASKALEQRKDTFLSMASHELKTPLTSLKLQTQLLRKQLAKQDTRRVDIALSRMEGQLNTATRLVEELLDISKIRAGKLEYAQETVDLNDVLQEIVEVLQQTQPTHTIVMSVPTSPVILSGDRDRLGQVFLNLIGNAIKYSPHANSVEVDMTTSTESVMITVRDHGIGIPREQRDKIFERFYRVASQQHSIPGLGMGLSIVEEIVEHHGGTITVESEIGTGSTFVVTFPVSPAH